MSSVDCEQLSLRVSRVLIILCRHFKIAGDCHKSSVVLIAIRYRIFPEMNIPF